MDQIVPTVFPNDTQQSTHCQVGCSAHDHFARWTPFNLDPLRCSRNAWLVPVSSGSRNTPPRTCSRGRSVTEKNRSTIVPGTISPSCFTETTWTLGILGGSGGADVATCVPSPICLAGDSRGLKGLS